MKAFAAVLTAVLLAAPAWAEDVFYCEVLALQGEVRIVSASGGNAVAKEGDLLSEGDFVEVPDDGWLDLAYDKDWSNVIRLEAGTKIKVSGISPARVTLEQGGVYAKLKKLPAKSSFEVETPTAIAAVRGTEYRTVVKDGKTEVFNFSPSKVFVYGVDPMGAKMPEPMVLEEEQKTAVDAKGENPSAAAPMDPAEKKECGTLQKGIEARIEQAVTSGREGKIQSVEEIERKMNAAPTRFDEDGRIADTRRRSFK